MNKIVTVWRKGKGNQSQRKFVAVMSKICKCGKRRQKPKRRYCDACGEVHSRIMHTSHIGKGTGKRRKN